MLAIQIDIPFYGISILFLAICYTSYLGRTNPNIVTLCLGFLVVISLEQIVFLYVPLEGTPQVWVNNNIYLIHIICDFSLLLFLIYRGALCRWLFNKWHKESNGLHLTNADISMLMVIAIITLVDIAALIENLLRNLEHLGFSEAIAKPLWELNWIFYHYGPIKYCLMGLMFLVLWSTVTQMAQKESKLLQRFMA